jgi:MSHA biogenesis protein MshM
MYEQHFGLAEMPFRITPDTGFAFAGRQHQEAFNTLMISVRNLEGFIKITGEVGTGKTLLCRRFLAMQDPSCATAYIPNPQLEPRALLLAIADELGLPLARDLDSHLMHKELTATLLALAGEGRKVVVCIDEAQAMPLETLETLRLLTNLETEKRKLIQVVLFGQPELDKHLADPRVRQLRQRITFQFNLGNLARDELRNYLSHRLRVAGQPRASVFEDAAVRAIYRYTGGLPRLVNIIAHKAMILAYGQGSEKVQAWHVREAARDTPAARPGMTRRVWLMALMAASVGLAWVVLP